MNYRFIIENMTWSYSRLTAFEDCPYGWFLKYIEGLPSESNFFAEYGSFIHKILQMFYDGELSKNQLPLYYLDQFSKEIKAMPPKATTWNNYYSQGYRYLSSFKPVCKKPNGVERKVQFEVSGKLFTGIVDLDFQDGELCIVDHKSRIFKGRKTKKESATLDSYLRQLYLYAIPIYEIYHKYPDKLGFNCFRSQEMIWEPFRFGELQKTKSWVAELIAAIERTSQWNPNPDYFRCRYLCDMREHCIYKNMIV